jgi:hypothetical protein
MTYLYLAILLAVGYGALCYWAIFGRGGFQYVYNGFIAWVLVNFMGRMQCITLGARCYGYAVNWQIQLTPQRRKHEEHHWTQQKRAPYTFFPRYLWLMVRYGYNAHPDEIDARAIAGEPPK